LRFIEEAWRFPQQFAPGRNRAFGGVRGADAGATRACHRGRFVPTRLRQTVSAFAKATMADRSARPTGAAEGATPRSCDATRASHPQREGSPRDEGVASPTSQLDHHVLGAGETVGGAVSVAQLLPTPFHLTVQIIIRPLRIMVE
jgi:hypothetical protein